MRWEHTITVPMFGSLNGHDMVMRARGIGVDISDELHDEAAYMPVEQAAPYLEDRAQVQFIDHYKHGTYVEIVQDGGRVDVKFRSTLQPKCQVVVPNLSRYDAAKMQVDFESSGLWYLFDYTPSVKG